MNEWERRHHNKVLKRVNWLDRNAGWLVVFIGTFWAGLALSLLNWGGYLLYEFVRNHPGYF